MLFMLEGRRVFANFAKEREKKTGKIIITDNHHVQRYFPSATCGAVQVWVGRAFTSEFDRMTNPIVAALWPIWWQSLWISFKDNRHIVKRFRLNVCNPIQSNAPYHISQFMVLTPTKSGCDDSDAHRKEFDTICYDFYFLMRINCMCLIEKVRPHLIKIKIIRNVFISNSQRTIEPTFEWKAPLQPKLLYAHNT